MVILTSGTFVNYWVLNRCRLFHSPCKMPPLRQDLRALNMFKDIQLGGGNLTDADNAGLIYQVSDH